MIGGAWNTLGWIGLSLFGGSLLAGTLVALAGRAGMFRGPPPPPLPPPPTQGELDLYECVGIWATTEAVARERSRRHHPSTRGET